MTEPPQKTAAPGRVAVAQLTPGRRVRTVLLVRGKRQDTARTGNAYLALVLGDRTGKVSARVWEAAERYGALFEAGDFIFVDGVTETYRGELQLRINHLERVSESAVEMSDFVPASRYDPSEMLAELRALVRSEVQDPAVATVLLAVLDDPEVTDGLLRAPAAKANHHAYLAGLLEHTLSVCRLAVRIGHHYEALYPDLLSTDHLVAGALLHDIGKIWEISADRSFDYTDTGRLLGHITLGVELLTRVLEQKGIDDDELAHRLKHMLLSHHGEPEYGAVVKPLTPEAQVLHFIDQIDSRLNMFAQAIEASTGSWSGYVSALRRSVYAGSSVVSQPDLEDEDIAAEVPATQPQAKPWRASSGVTGDRTSPDPLHAPKPPAWLDADLDESLLAFGPDGHVPAEEALFALTPPAPEDSAAGVAGEVVRDSAVPPDRPTESPEDAPHDDLTLDLFDSSEAGDAGVTGRRG